MSKLSLAALNLTFCLAASATELTTGNVDEASGQVGLNFRAGTQWQFSSKAISHLNSAITKFDSTGRTSFGFRIFEKDRARTCNIASTKESATKKLQITANDKWTISDLGKWRDVGHGRFLRNSTLTSQKGDTLAMECMIRAGATTIAKDEEPDIFDVTPQGAHTPSGSSSAR